MNNVNPKRTLSTAERTMLGGDLNVVNLSVAQTREALDGVHTEELENALDEAQGIVHAGEDEAVYIVIRVTA